MLLIGWSQVDITPAKPVQLHGQFYERVSERVRDPLSATVLALEGVGVSGAREQAILVSCDLVGIPDGFQARLRQQLAPRMPDFDTQKLWLNATHIHTGPTVQEAWHHTDRPEVSRPADYAAWLLGRLSDGIVAAWQGRTRGSVSWALGHAVVGHNRRVVYADGSAVMYGTTDTPGFLCLEGDEDHAVELLYWWDERQELTGVLINVACPSQIVEHRRFISADYWGAVRLELARRFGRPIRVLAQCSAAGDQSPRDLVRRNRGEPNMYGEEGLPELARRIVDAVQHAYPAAKATACADPTFAHRLRTLGLPKRLVTAEEYQQARGQAEALAAGEPLDSWTKAYIVSTLNEGGRPYDTVIAQRPQDRTSIEATMRYIAKVIMERYEAQTLSNLHCMELHVLRIGDIAMVSNPFELYLDYGWRIKAQSVAKQTLVVQLACSTAGYLPTARAVQAGGYSATIGSNQVGPQGGDVLVAESVAAINALWDTPIGGAA